MDNSKAAQPSEPQRVVFPNAHADPTQQSLYAWFRRHLILFWLYFLWIFGIGFHLCMEVYSVVCIVRVVVGRANGVDFVTLPHQVQRYLLFLVLYHTYHYVMYRRTPQPGWLALRNFCRQSLAKYPYFRHQACILEEREDECLAKPFEPMVPPSDKALFAYHPHGVLSCAWAVNGVQSMRFVLSEARWLVAEGFFWFPVIGDISRWIDAWDVSKRRMVGYMKEKRNVCLLPGGFEEATLFQYGKHRVYIKKRAGFIKLALQHGYKVHPVYTFGEELTYRTLPFFLKQRLLLNQWKVPGVVFFGRLLCFFMPLPDLNLVTVVGKPIQLPQIDHPTREDVAKYHKMYIDALESLFERHKHKYAADPSVSLEIY